MADSSPVISGQTGTVTYTYDAMNRLANVSQDGNASVADKYVAFTYNYAGQYLSINRHAGLNAAAPLIATSAYTLYDGLGRLKTVQQQYRPDGVNLATLVDYTWSYDAASRIGSLGIDHANPAYDETFTYTLDGIDQLTDVAKNGTPTEDYNYDAAGNRTNNGFTVDAAKKNNLLASDGTYTYTYDDEGNRVMRRRNSDGATTRYEWDHRNRLIRVSEHPNDNIATAATSAVEYTYDAFDRRIRKMVDSNGDTAGGMSYSYQVHQGDHAHLEITDPDSLAGATAPTMSRRYLYGRAVDQILAADDLLGHARWALADHEGTIRDVVNGAGTLIYHRKYDSFGKSVDGTTPAADFLFGYAGRPLDPNTGLYDNRARWYDPGVGRFASEDPSGLTSDMNLYRYAGNSPVDYTDPSGLGRESLFNSSWSEPSLPDSIGMLPVGNATYLGPTNPFNPVPSWLGTNLGAPGLSEREAILGRLGSDPNNISWSAIRGLQAEGLASADIYSYEERGWFTGATAKVAIPLPREDGGMDTMTAKMVVPWLWGDAYFQSVGITTNTTPAQQATRIDAGNRYARDMAMKAGSDRMQFEGGVYLAASGPVGAILGANQAGTAVVNVATGRDHETPIATGASNWVQYVGGYSQADARVAGRWADNGITLVGGLVSQPWTPEPMVVLPRPKAPIAPIHGNSLDYVGDTHVYSIRGPNGTYKIGESMQGVRASDGLSIRGESQARALTRETGDLYGSEIRRTFPDKASARDYETRLIERFRRMFGDDALPGNKTNR